MTYAAISLCLLVNHASACLVISSRGKTQTCMFGVLCFALALHAQQSPSMVIGHDISNHGL